VYPAIAALCVLPRLAILLHERGSITASFTEKSDTFAQTFVQHGTFGFLPGEPSAYTQPLYAWFLIPVYWIFGRSWVSIGLAQIALAVVTAILVFEIGRRVLGPRAGVAAAAIATLNPYLAWHDVHVNREIVDQVCAASLVLLTLAVAERPSRRLATLVGVVGGLAILGNTRLVGVPILCAAYLVWRSWPRSCWRAPESPSRRGSSATRRRSAAGRSRPTAALSGRRTTCRRTASSRTVSGSMTCVQTRLVLRRRTATTRRRRGAISRRDDRTWRTASIRTSASP
jgi:hypothetical protein